MSPVPYARRSDADFVATITLDRPDRLNAFDGHDVDQFRSVLVELSTDAAVRAVVLTGAGRAFCAGGDLRTMSSSAASGGGGEPVPPMRQLAEVVELLHRMPKVTIAAINGPCAGAGLCFAAACDLRVAAPGSVFTTAFAKVGQSGDYGSAWFLTRLVGRSRAAAMLLLAERFDTAVAVDAGLVNVVADDAVAHAHALGRRVAALAPLTVAAIKENLRDADDLDLGRYLDNECDRFLATLATEDAREAARAYVEKREPSFKGR